MSECANNLESAIKKDGDLSEILFQGSSDKPIIVDLQKTLFELGFKKKLKWDNYQADGSYGGATKNAVKAFADKNHFEVDGSKVTDKLGSKMVERHQFLPNMYHLYQIYSSDLRTRYYISKGLKDSIMAIQVLMNELGYIKSQTGEKLKIDGMYGPETQSALITFASDNGIETDGDFLTRPFVDLLMEAIDVYYGPDWSDLASNNLPNSNSPLILFYASRFVGNPCRADKLFSPALNQINAYAEQADVHIYVTSSFRTTTNVKGAIVKPATFSNHLIGHGIDMNVIYGNNEFANSSVLTKYPNVPEPVRKFLKFIIDDPKLRWGGNFNTKDPVHIDDGYNRNLEKWKERYEMMQKAVQLGQV